MSLPVSEYKVIAGPPKQVETELAQLALKGWKPILMSSNANVGGNSVYVIIVLELPAGGGT